MASYSKVIIIGNLVREVEVRYLPKGTAVADVTVAVNRKWRADNDEMKEDVAFVDCTLFGRKAEVAGQYLSKGKPVFFEGYFKTESWTDKASGQKRSKLKVMVDQMQFIGTKSGDETEQPAPSDDQQARQVPPTKRDEGGGPVSQEDESRIPF